MLSPSQLKFNMLESELSLSFTWDGMAADDGHNALVSCYCSPSNPLFEEDLRDKVWWIFPPSDLIGITLKFLVSSLKEKIPFICCVLLPEHSSAPWYKYLVHFTPVKRFSPGADLFRLRSGDQFIRDRPIKGYWRVLRLQSPIA